MGDLGGLVAVVVLVAANAFFVAVEFGLVAVAPVAVPAVSAVILLANPSAGIEWIAAGFVIGTAVQAAPSMRSPSERQAAAASATGTVSATPPQAIAI